MVSMQYNPKDGVNEFVLHPYTPEIVWLKLPLKIGKRATNSALA